MISTMDVGRTALLIRCSTEEAARVHAQALTEHRSVSGCLLHILERSLRIEENYAASLTHGFVDARARDFRLSRAKISRTAMLLRCSAEEARRIRVAAKRRKMSISELVVFLLPRRHKSTGSAEPRFRTVSYGLDCSSQRVLSATSAGRRLGGTCLSAINRGAGTAGLDFLRHDGLEAAFPNRATV